MSSFKLPVAICLSLACAAPAFAGDPPKLFNQPPVYDMPVLLPGINQVMFDKNHPIRTIESRRIILVALPPQVSAVPEPSSWMTMLAGFGAIGAALRSTRRARTSIA